jgi:RNA polymerase sigma factor (sigma-70 family)
MEPAEVEPFRRGERAALERVYRGHVAAVERFARLALLRMRRFTGANLSDLVQEVFMRAFSASARASYDGRREYAPYLMTIARNVVIDWHRRTSREPLDPLELETLLEGGASELPAAEAFPAELVSRVARYVDGLSPLLRGVHEQRFVLSEPQHRAAEALGISRQNLRTLEKKLIDGLRRELRDERFSETARAASTRPAPKFVNPSARSNRP